ncbi:MAG TPA: hypothetical protein VJ850_09080 [Candidatus Limnocylindrales bacterium]|nr:hypothetical protein [Candidatus Limnocylindrales bacterium]
MTDDRSKPVDGDVLRKTNQPTDFLRRPTEPTLKKSRYCEHGNVWGRCPHGC